MFCQISSFFNRDSVIVELIILVSAHFPLCWFNFRSAVWQQCLNPSASSGGMRYCKDDETPPRCVFHRVKFLSRTSWKYNHQLSRALIATKLVRSCESLSSHKASGIPQCWSFLQRYFAKVYVEITLHPVLAIGSGRAGIAPLPTHTPSASRYCSVGDGNMFWGDSSTTLRIALRARGGQTFPTSTHGLVWRRKHWYFQIWGKWHLMLPWNVVWVEKRTLRNDLKNDRNTPVLVWT